MWKCLAEIRRTETDRPPDCHWQSAAGCQRDLGCISQSNVGAQPHHEVKHCKTYDETAATPCDDGSMSDLRTQERRNQISHCPVIANSFPTTPSLRRQIPNDNAHQMDFAFCARPSELDLRSNGGAGIILRRKCFGLPSTTAAGKPFRIRN
jgi:hypothetical protein